MQLAMQRHCTRRTHAAVQSIAAMARVTTTERRHSSAAAMSAHAALPVGSAASPAAAAAAAAATSARHVARSVQGSMQHTGTIASTATPATPAVANAGAPTLIARISPRECRRAQAIAARIAAAADTTDSTSSSSGSASSGAPPTSSSGGSSSSAAAADPLEFGGPRLHPGVATRDLKPSELVKEMDRFIIGQQDAKKAVAIALRNRWRRHKLPEDMRAEVTPKNILMIGPTGCGKTEIARRLARLTESPFIKVEATKFTEVGFHGKDVDTIVSDLVRIAIQGLKTRRKAEAKAAIQRAVQDKILEALTAGGSSAETFRLPLEQGALEGIEIEIEVPIKDPSSESVDREGRQDPRRDAFSAIVQSMQNRLSGKRTEMRKLTISEARPLLEEAHMDTLFRPEDLVKDALKAVAEDGIVFIDEIDKIASGGSESARSADASAEGVQRDLLPLIEGTTVTTKQGDVATDHILFIASGAFHSVKPSDLLAELQGRLPIRVELTALTEDELYRILSQTENNLIQQQVELLAVDNVKLLWKDDAVREIAKVACEVNRSVENIGARRLNTVIERIVDDISYTASDVPAGTEYVIDAPFVRSKVAELLKTTDLGKFIL